MFGKRKDANAVSPAESPEDKTRGQVTTDLPPLENDSRSTWDRIWPTLACGAGLFSDGYLQSVIGPVGTALALAYPDAWAGSSARQNVSSIAFVGTVVGQLFFGYTSDHYSRKWSLLVSTIILFVFAALGAGSYGAGGSPYGLLAALTAYRFLLGIGIGGEYPAGSVGAAESSAEIKAGHRNRWFCLFTNTQIDFGFVMGNVIPTIVAAIAPDRYNTIWRVSLAIGVVPPLMLLYLRIKLKEPESFSRNSFRGTKTPYKLAFKYYGFRLLIVAAIWFIYDFLAYPFGIYANVIIGAIIPNAPLWQQFGWGALINFFYLPGAILGSFTSDWMGPRRALCTFVIVQGIMAFIMSGCLYWLRMDQYIGAFVVVYGLFLSFGEMGPGDNIGLVASKTCATGIRGQYYAIAAATGKIGGFIGSYVFPIIENDGGGKTTLHGQQYPFYVAGALCFVAAGLVLLLPHIGQDTIEEEDIKFRAYLEEHGWDTSAMGSKEWQERRASVAAAADVKN